MSEETNTETSVATCVVGSTENIQKLNDLFHTFLKDSSKFYTKGTASAAARARKSLSKLSKLNKEVRKEIQTEKKVKVASRKAAKAAAIVAA